MTNHHATVVVLGDVGLLLEGPSGSGKSAVALRLVDQWRKAGHHAAFCGDDQVFLSARSGRLMARGPANLAGLAEHRGLGLVDVPWQGPVVIDVVACLEPSERLQRLPDPRHEERSGIRLRAIDLPAGDPERAATLCAAFIAQCGKG